MEKRKPGIIKVKVCGGEIRSGLSSGLCQKEICRLGNNLKCRNTLSKDRNILSKIQLLCQKTKIFCKNTNTLSKDTKSLSKGSLEIVNWKIKSNISEVPNKPMHCRGTRLITAILNPVPPHCTIITIQICLRKFHM